MIDQEATKATVTHSNRLVSAAQSLTLNEKRVLLACIARIDPRKPFRDGLMYLSANQFAELFGIDVRNAYPALEDAAKRLFNRDIRHVVDGKVVEQWRWVYQVKYHQGEGRISLAFSPTIAPELTLLHREFTTYQLRQVGKLPSFYAIRLYELLSQVRVIGSRSIMLDELRAILVLEDKYPLSKDLRVRVIDPAVREINANTDLRIEHIAIKKSRSVVGYRFKVEVLPTTGDPNASAPQIPGPVSP